MQLKSTIAGAAVLALTCGCGSSPSQPEANYAQYEQNELESERQEFMTEANERLSKLDSEIALLETKLKHESPYVDEEQRAEWRQDLFERKQEQAKVRAELTRAQNVSAADWKQMRGEMGVAIDTMESGTKKLRDDILRAFESKSPPEGAKLRADMGLCPLDVKEADAEVTKTNTSVVVVVTTDEGELVPELQRRAKELAKSDAYTPTSGPSTGAPAVVPVKIQAQQVAEGAKLSFVPTFSGHLDQLYSQVQQDAELLGKDRCEMQPGATGMR